MKQYSLLMRVASTLLFWKASHILVTNVVHNDGSRRGVLLWIGLTQPTLLWTHTPPVVSRRCQYLCRRKKIKINKSVVGLVGLKTRGCGKSMVSVGSYLVWEEAVGGCMETRGLMHRVGVQVMMIYTRAVFLLKMEGEL